MKTLLIILVILLVGCSNRYNYSHKYQKSKETKPYPYNVTPPWK